MIWQKSDHERTVTSFKASAAVSRLSACLSLSLSLSLSVPLFSSFTFTFNSPESGCLPDKQPTDESWRCRDAHLFTARNWRPGILKKKFTTSHSLFLSFSLSFYLSLSLSLFLSLFLTLSFILSFSLSLFCLSLLLSLFYLSLSLFLLCLSLSPASLDTYPWLSAAPAFKWGRFLSTEQSVAILKSPSLFQPRIRPYVSSGILFRNGTLSLSEWPEPMCVCIVTAKVCICVCVCVCV